MKREVHPSNKNQYSRPPVRKHDDRLLRIADIQEICCCSRTKAYGILRNVKHLRVDGTIRIWESALLEYLETCVVDPSEVTA